MGRVPVVHWVSSEPHIHRVNSHYYYKNNPAGYTSKYKNNVSKLWIALGEVFIANFDETSGSREVEEKNNCQ
jgi:hypothetical protein